MDEFPSEILYNIANSLNDDPQYLALRLVSRRYNAIFTPFIVRHVGLRIEPFHITLAYFQPTRRSQPIPEVFVKNITSLQLNMTIAGHRFLGTIFWVELSRFTGLKTLQISCGSMTMTTEVKSLPPLQVINRVLDAIFKATNGGLAHLTLTNSCLLKTFPSALIKFRCLESFCFRHICSKRFSWEVCDADHESLIQLRTLIENNPSLQTLEYTYDCREFPVSPEHVFPSTRESMVLRKLSVYGDLLPTPNTLAQPFLLPTLKHLRHLEFINDGLNPPAIIDQFWMALAKDRVALKKLATSYTSPAFLNYMASFKGLQECTINRLDPDPTFTTSSVHHAFTNHGSTLEVLHIKSRVTYISSGCSVFSLSLSNNSANGRNPTWIQPSTFPKLRKLTVITFDSGDCYNSFHDFFSTFPNLSDATVVRYDSADSQHEWLRSGQRQLIDPMAYHFP